MAMDAGRINLLFQLLWDQHGLTGLVSKLCLALALLLAALDRDPRAKRLTPLVFAVLALNSVRLCVGTETWLAALPSLVLLGAAGWVVAQPEGKLTPLPAGEETGRRAVAWIGLVAAFWYPVFGYRLEFSSLWSAVWYSPMGALPHQAALAAVVVAWSSWPNTPRLFGTGAAASAGLLGLLDVAWLGRWSGLVLLAAAAILLVKLFASAKRKGLSNDDRPPLDEIVEAKLKERQGQATKQGERVWKLK
ncbi:MAG: hypothetical protein SF028_14715 [Candidatus Sumerlaeia bacterium]|nr:hypothetical protein [Candidatus Sumerlaeia bacterium]